MTVDWTTIATATTGAAIVLLAAIAACIYRGLLKESVRAADARVYFQVLDSLQDEPVRLARGNLLAMPDKDYHRWTASERADAEIVCQSYDSIGIMISAKMLKPDTVIPHWHNSIRRCWEKASPLIGAYRASRGDDYWDDFEGLFKLALQHEAKLPSASSPARTGDGASLWSEHYARWIGVAAAVALIVTAGAWYARRRWLG